MDASQILTDDMTLEEKLQAIENAMSDAMEQAKQAAVQAGRPFVPLDPADLTVCEGCQ